MSKGDWLVELKKTRGKLDQKLRMMKVVVLLPKVGTKQVDKEMIHEQIFETIKEKKIFSELEDDTGWSHV